MLPYLTDEFGNASSAHAMGRPARRAVEQARAQVADLLGANADEIAFTSCGSESDNWAIGGYLEANPGRRHIITTRAEHEAVRGLCEHLEQAGYEVSWLDVDRQGELDLDQLEKALRRDTAIVSAMMANNETGVLFPIREIGQIVREHSDAVFHVDGVQAVGKVPIDMNQLPVDLFSISGHKFHAPKGVGALYIRRGIKLPPFIIGGGQEQGRRSGTEAVPNVVAMGRAAQLAKESSEHDRIYQLRNYLEDEVLRRFANAQVNGTTDRAKRLPNTSNISFAEREGSEIRAQLDASGICVSTGSACSADSREASGVLRAMNIPYEVARGAIRFSLGRYNTPVEIEEALAALEQILN